MLNLLGSKLKPDSQVVKALLHFQLAQTLRPEIKDPVMRM
jgi:hypothetical protein